MNYKRRHSNIANLSFVDENNMIEFHRKKINQFDDQTEN